MIVSNKFQYFIKIRIIICFFNKYRYFILKNIIRIFLIINGHKNIPIV